MDPISVTTGSIFLLLMFSSFIRILILLSIVRIGLGFNGTGFGIATALIALVLSLALVEPNLNGGTESLLTGKTDQVKLIEQLKPYIARRTDAEVLNQLAKLRTTQEPPIVDPVIKPELGLQLAAFTLSELKRAFQMGLALLLPFVVIDLLVTNLMLALSITQIPALLISLPLKLLLFVSLDGWRLIVEKLMVN